MHSSDLTNGHKRYVSTAYMTAFHISTVIQVLIKGVITKSISIQMDWTSLFCYFCQDNYVQ